MGELEKVRLFIVSGVRGGGWVGGWVVVVGLLLLLVRERDG